MRINRFTQEDVQELDRITERNARQFFRPDGTLKPIESLTDEQRACIEELKVVKRPSGTYRFLKLNGKVTEIGGKINKTTPRRRKRG